MRTNQRGSRHAPALAWRRKRASASRSMVDHAGQPTTSFNPSLIGVGKDAGTGGMSREAYLAFMRDMRRRHAELVGARCIGGFVVLFIIMLATMAFMDLAMDGFTLNSIRQFAWLIILALVAVYMFTSSGLPHETMIKELLARSRCASCGFDLVGVPPDDEGLSRCPECGSRWRIAPKPPSSQRESPVLADGPL